MSHGHDSHDSHDSHDAHGSHASPEPEAVPPTPPHVLTIARISSRIGQALIALGLLGALVQLIRFQFVPSVGAAAFVSLYGLCIWLAGRATIDNASHG